MQCPLCGYEFDASQMSCHSSCAFNQGCAIICCPNCGYQMADERRLRFTGLVREFLARRRRDREASAGTHKLSRLCPGQSGRIVAVDSPNHARMEKLHVLGLVPDTWMTLDQRQPTYVLRVGFTELSIEREIADDILVEVLE